MGKVTASLNNGFNAPSNPPLTVMDPVTSTHPLIVSARFAALDPLDVAFGVAFGVADDLVTGDGLLLAADSAEVDLLSASLDGDAETGISEEVAEADLLSASLDGDAEAEISEEVAFFFAALLTVELAALLTVELAASTPAMAVALGVAAADGPTLTCNPTDPAMSTSMNTDALARPFTKSTPRSIYVMVVSKYTWR